MTDEKKKKVTATTKIKEKAKAESKAEVTEDVFMPDMEGSFDIDLDFASMVPDEEEIIEMLLNLCPATQMGPLSQFLSYYKNQSNKNIRLGQELANYDLWAKSNSLPIFVQPTT